MRRLAIFSCGFAAAVALYVWLLRPLWALCMGLGLLAFGLVALLRSGNRAERLRIFSFGAVLALLWCWCYEQVNILPMQTLCGENRQITAEVCDIPEQTSYGCRTICRLEKGKILLYLNADAETLSMGDTLRLTADISASNRQTSLYYQSRDIALMGYQKGQLSVEKAEKLPLRYAPKAVLLRTRAMIDRIFPADTAGFMNALLTGDTSGVSYEVSNEMSVAGIVHVVSVSGMHISLIANAVMLLCLQRRKAAAAVSFVAMLFFVAMLGFTPSAMRAFLMQCVFLLAPLVKRENDTPTALALSLLVLLMLNPWSIANVSLQLSFASMAGIVTFARPIFAWQLSLPKLSALAEKDGLARKICRGFATTNATSLGATVFTTPLVAWYFGAVSLISPVANLLTLAPLSWAFCGGCAAVLLGFVFRPVAVPVAWAVSWLVRYALWAVDWLAALPYAAVYTKSVYVIAWLIAMYLLLAVFLSRKRKRPTSLALSLVASLLCVLGFSMLTPTELTMTALDVGQGQAIVLQSGNLVAMVDCGGDSGEADGEAAARHILMYGTDRLDILVLTHYDTDHVCGLAQLLSRVEVGQLLIPDISDDAGNRAEVTALAAAYGVPILTVTEDVTVRFAQGELRVFAPMSGKSDNAGLSALMSAGEYDILITGDMDMAAEERLLDTRELPDIEVLVAGHHGSKYSTSSRFLEALRPETVLISVGENSYGHPTPEVLDRVAQIGAAVYRTDLNGDITIMR